MKHFYDDERLVCDYLICFFFVYDKDECGFSNIEYICFVGN